MKTSSFPSFILVACLWTSAAAVGAAESFPSFDGKPSTNDWAIARGKLKAGAETLASEGALPLELRTAREVSGPVEMSVRFTTKAVGSLTVAAFEGTNFARPALEVAFMPRSPTQAAILAKADGAPMATDIPSVRAWSLRDKSHGALTYAWRFPQVKNLWDERDRREIGASYARLARFDEKTFELRLRLADGMRQAWLDDRLVAEGKGSLPSARFLLRLGGETRILAARFSAPAPTAPFLPVSLARWSHRKDAPAGHPAPAAPARGPEGREVPVALPEGAWPDVALGDSLDRYRLSAKGGPQASYVNAQVAWPGAFEVDPAVLTFRVPYRAYQNAWLVAWLDETPGAVPRGVFRFYREKAGYAAATPFEVTEEAIRKGLVTRLGRKAPNGRDLYLVRVPVDSDALQGFHDLEGTHLDFELSRPLALGRSYPDPIYYGEHPAGPPSSVHVAAITLEEAPFDFAVTPAQRGFVFERPGKAVQRVAVTNLGSRPIEAKVTLGSRSLDGSEKGEASATVKVAPGASAEASLALDPKLNGWHELRAEVEAGGARRARTLSMVMLPPDTRSRGTAPNETRFGVWSLWGHYLPLKPGDFEGNDEWIAMFRKLGLRRIDAHASFLKVESLKKHGFIAKAPHTIVAVFHRLNEKDPEAMKKMVADELAQVEESREMPAGYTYFYGGEWHIGREIQYGVWPEYTGEGTRPFTEDEVQRLTRHTTIWTAIGRAMREKFPGVKLILQWGANPGTLAYMRHGFPKELVDGYGMDAPQFELLPEIPWATGSIQRLWMLRAEAKRLGWPALPISWCEGPFFPTNPGALTEREQMDYQVRYWLHGLAYGVEDFQAAVVPHDAGNYYGAEHYGAGIFNRLPLEHPKPAVAAVATATTMLCGADRVGPVDTGVATTYCLAFQRPGQPGKIFALWRAAGRAEGRLAVEGGEAVLTDAMGNARKLPAKDGAVTVEVSTSPVWLTGVSAVKGFQWQAPRYEETPAAVTRPLAPLVAANWRLDAAEDAAYAQNHFSVRRIAEPAIRAEFGAPSEGKGEAVAIALPEQPPNRPMAIRYAALRAAKPVPIPGKPAALGVWVRGNSSWGRFAFRLRDAKGEAWLSLGTKDDWNCDDPHGWSFVDYEGWRYVRFPLPGNREWDAARELESTWWGSQGGDGIVDLPLSLEAVYVEALNEVPYLGEMRKVADRSYSLAGLRAEYASEADAAPEAIARSARRMPLPEWSGPTDNPIAKLAAEGVGEAPAIAKFEEPHHWNDGRRMVIRFAAKPGLKYNLWLSVEADGRGAELLKADVTDGLLVTGMKPDTPMYLFLTSVGPDKKESKPSAAFKLVTRDNFAEK